MPIQLKTAAITLGAAIVGVYVGYQINPPLPIENDVIVATESQEHLHTAIAQLQEENKKLRQTLASQQAASALPSQTSRQENPASQEDPTNQEKLASQTIDREHFAPSESFGQWLAQKNTTSANFNLGSEMQRRFDAEEINSSWAEQQTEVYDSLFIDSKELSGFALKDTQCRSTQCAITVGITDMEQANTLINNMSASLKNQGKYPLIISVPNIEQGTSTLYISENKNSFEPGSLPAMN